MRNGIVNGIIRVFVYHLITKWIYRFFYKGGALLLLVLLGFLASMFLTGCGSSGGGASPSSTEPTPTIPTPSTPTAEAKYYGFSSDSNISLVQTTMSGIANEVGLNIRDVNNRVFDIGIFQPECIQGLIEYDYNLIIIDGSTTAPAKYRARLSSNAISLYKVADGSGSSYETSLVISTATCAGGVYTLNNGQLVANGKTLLYRTFSGDLYFGINKQILLTDKSLLLSKKFYQYCQTDHNSVSYQNSLSLWSGNAGMEYTDPSASSSFSAFGFSSPNTMQKYMCASSRGSIYSIGSNQFSRIWDGNSTYTPFYGVTAQIGGKILFFSSMVYKNCSAPDYYTHSGVSVCDPVGAGAVNFFIEQ